MSGIHMGQWGRLLLLPYMLGVFPAVEQELKKWRSQAHAIPDEELCKQALASIKNKRFHCQGGAFYVLYAPASKTHLVRFIVALQTISDYLDNLCDRVPGVTEAGLRGLHQAFLAALDPGLPLTDWYGSYPLRDDGGYLTSLVKECRNSAEQLPRYHEVLPELVRLGSLYSSLQVYKHLSWDLREAKLKTWAQKNVDLAPGTHWWEFSAAAGSTLGIFGLTAAAASDPLNAAEKKSFLSCYFPWVSGLHILLDYYIDMDEDNAHGDLNFVSYYQCDQDIKNGIYVFLTKAIDRAGTLPRPCFHRMVVKGLLALYLSDPKALLSNRKQISQQLLRYGGKEVRLLHRLCTVLRAGGLI